mmetsp:Transcript_39008/g.102803  ORF Transcript_39008/g.102803 Transcript_39008/m.102803 type:complete len:202 (-) Transcript_39008:5-610(-)
MNSLGLRGVDGLHQRRLASVATRQSRWHVAARLCCWPRAVGGCIDGCDGSAVSAHGSVRTKLDARLLDRGCTPADPLLERVSLLEHQPLLLHFGIASLLCGPCCCRALLFDKMLAAHLLAVVMGMVDCCLRPVFVTELVEANARSRTGVFAHVHLHKILDFLEVLVILAVSLEVMPQQVPDLSHLLAVLAVELGELGLLVH